MIKKDLTAVTRHNEIPQLIKTKEQSKKTQLLVPLEELYQFDRLCVPQGCMRRTIYVVAK